MSRIVLTILGWGLLAGAAFAQTSTATLQGAVRDSSGAAVPEAAVAIANVNTGVTNKAATNVQGRFVVPFLAPGEYAVKVEKAGFQQHSQSGIRLEVQQVLDLDIELRLGDVATTIEVEAAPPPLATSTSTVSAAIEHKQIIDLPLNGRNALNLAVLVPGAIPAGGTASGPNRTPWLSGGRNSTGEFRLDGSSLTITEPGPGVTQLGGGVPSVDAIEEFAVLTNALAAEYGRTGGGAVLIASKQGTNRLRGTAYWFLRNSKLDANDFFRNRAGIPLSAMQRNQFGGSAGGPVIIPKLYDGRNRTFFFVDYQGTRQRTPLDLNTTVPLAEWKRGDFSALRNAQGLPILVYDPLTVRQEGSAYIRTAFPGNRVPEARFDPVARNAIPFYPEPNARPVNPYTQVNNYFQTGTNTSNGFNFNLRLDHNYTPAWRTFVRLTRGVGSVKAPNLFGNPGTPLGRTNSDSSSDSASWDNTYTISPTAILNVNYGLAYRTSVQFPLSVGYDPTQLGFPAYIREQAAKLYTRFPVFNVAGISNLGQGTGLGRFWTGHNLLGALTKVFTRHTVKVGAEFKSLPLNDWVENSPAGTYSFNEGWTQRNPVQRVATEGFGLASFLLGLPSSGALNLPLDPAVNSTYWGVYIQDDFRATRNLTLNLGLRYEVDNPRTERFNRMSYFDLGARSPIAGRVPGFPNLVGEMRFVDPKNRYQTPTDFNNVSPRFGFAYRIGQKTVARGGYGLMYAPSAMQSATREAGFEGFDSNTSMIVSLDGRTPLNYLRHPFPDGFEIPLGAAPGPISGPNTALGLNMQSSWFIDYVNPVVQQWNFNLQRQLPGSIVVEAGYMGSKGNHLLDGETTAYNQLPASFFAMGDSLNDLVPNPFAGAIVNPLSTLSRPTVRRGQLLRPYPQYTAMNARWRPTGNSIYHGFTLRVDKRFSRGLGFLVSYTAGKLIDDCGFGNTITSVNSNTARQDAYNRASDRSVSSEDISQRLVASFNFDLPVGRGRMFLGGASTPVQLLLGGWQVNGIVTFQGGFPVAIFQNANNTGLFTSAQRPNNNGRSAAIQGGTRDERLLKWFDPSVFSLAPAFTFGNAPRILPDVRHPGSRDCDLSLFKTVRIREDRLSAQFRLEAFNAFNTPSFDRAGATVGSPGIGIIGDTAGSPRQVQLALKLIF